MTVSPAERQYILSQVGRLAAADLDALWAHASALPSNEFADYVIQAFPELADPHAAMAAELAAAWYAESPSETDHEPVPGPLPVREKLVASAQWALGGAGLIGRDRLHGTLQRAVYDGARQTILDNATAEGARWARHASANACAFCALMASRGAVYTSEAAALRVTGRRPEITLGDRRAIAAGLMTREQAYANRERYSSARAARKAGFGVGDVKVRRTRGSRDLGEKYHDGCHCIAVEVRPGRSYQPPEYVEKWADAYNTATRETPGKGEFGAVDLNAVLAHMRENLGTH